MENIKEKLFVDHVKKHLHRNEKVVCKICNKDIDEITIHDRIKILENKLKKIEKSKKDNKKIIVMFILASVYVIFMVILLEFLTY